MTKKASDLSSKPVMTRHQLETNLRGNEVIDREAGVYPALVRVRADEFLKYRFTPDARRLVVSWAAEKFNAPFTYVHIETSEDRLNRSLASLGFFLSRSSGIDSFVDNARELLIRMHRESLVSSTEPSDVRGTYLSLLERYATLESYMEVVPCSVDGALVLYSYPGELEGEKQFVHLVVDSACPKELNDMPMDRGGGLKRDNSGSTGVNPLG